MLYNIRSAENVGAIFRTADAAGVSKIFLVGYTPAPIDRFGRARQDIAKSALGAERIIPWQHFKTITEVIKNLKKEKISIIALEQSRKARDYKKIKPKNSFCLVLGNEVSGIPPSVLREAESIVEIPMRGEKESLNVSVAAGITLYRILKI